MSALVEFSMSPLDKGISLSKYVARTLDIVDRSGLPYRLTPMGTILEGDFEACMQVITKCYHRMSEDCDRISCSIKIDDRKGADGRLDAKIASVERQLQRKLKT
jgi:uncharacterized protein (TIGR00106 family)